MNQTEVKFNDIIDQKDLKEGNIIVLASRPAIGKTMTSCLLAKKFSKSYKYLYFDLSFNGLDIFNRYGIVSYNEYFSSIEMIKQIEKEILIKEVKLIFIDYWQLLDDKRDWVMQKLREFSSKYKIVFIINLQLGRKVEDRKSKMPKEKDIKKVFEYQVKKFIVLTRPAIYSKTQTDKMIKYIKYQ